MKRVEKFIKVGLIEKVATTMSDPEHDKMMLINLGILDFDNNIYVGRISCFVRIVLSTVLSTLFILCTVLIISNSNTQNTSQRVGEVSYYGQPTIPFYQDIVRLEAVKSIGISNSYINSNYTFIDEDKVIIKFKIVETYNDYVNYKSEYECLQEDNIHKPIYIELNRCYLTEMPIVSSYLYKLGTAREEYVVGEGYTRVFNCSRVGDELIPIVYDSVVKKDVVCSELQNVQENNILLSKTRLCFIKTFTNTNNSLDLDDLINILKEIGKTKKTNK